MRKRKARHRELSHGSGPIIKRQIEELKVGKCPVTDKNMYPSHKDASAALKIIRKRTKARMRVYHCVYCKSFHFGHWRPPQKRTPDPYGLKTGDKLSKKVKNPLV